MLKILSKWFGKKPPRPASTILPEKVRTDIQQKLRYTFNDISYLSRALTHRSYLRANELGLNRAYERLEFLGDSVLGLIVAEELFKKYPDMSEGGLTKNKSLLVNKKVLTHAGFTISLGDYVFMSADEERAGGRQRESIIADCLEAIIGAIYLDGGLDAAKRVVRELISFDFTQTSEALSLRNYKGELLEKLQARGGGMPRYTVTDEEGPDHRKVFTVDVYIGGKRMGSGKGDSKKSAEQKAAESALASLDNN
jgi:ribonuclease-3